MSNGLSEERWRRLVHAVAKDHGDDPVGQSWGVLLVDLYGGADRHYHARRHLDYVLSLHDEHRHRFRDPVTAELALWFHDSIYVVPSNRNEGQSADLCGAFLTSVGAVDHWAACAMIQATTHDGSPCADPDTALVLDIDLAGFARPWDEFNADNASIRREFAIYDDATYNAGRVAFLRKLLDRGPIYRVLTEIEAPARANIERHIADLLGAGTLKEG